MTNAPLESSSRRDFLKAAGAAAMTATAMTSSTGPTIVGATDKAGSKKSVIGSSCAIMKSIPPNTQVTLERAQLRFREAS